MNGTDVQENHWCYGKVAGGAVVADLDPGADVVPVMLLVGGDVETDIVDDTGVTVVAESGMEGKKKTETDGVLCLLMHAQREILRFRKHGVYLTDNLPP